MRVWLIAGLVTALVGVPAAEARHDQLDRAKAIEQADLTVAEFGRQVPNFSPTSVGVTGCGRDSSYATRYRATKSGRKRRIELGRRYTCDVTYRVFVPLRLCYDVDGSTICEDSSYLSDCYVSVEVKRRHGGKLRFQVTDYDARTVCTPPQFG